MLPILIKVSCVVLPDTRSGHGSYMGQQMPSAPSRLPMKQDRLRLCSLSFFVSTSFCIFFSVENTGGGYGNAH